MLAQDQKIDLGKDLIDSTHFAKAKPSIFLYSKQKKTFFGF